MTSAEYSLCGLWMHREEACLKYWEYVDIYSISTYYINVYCSVYLNNLLSYQKSSGVECKIEKVTNCLRLFNLEGADVRNSEEIENLNVVIGKTIERYLL